MSTGGGNESDFRRAMEDVQPVDEPRRRSFRRRREKAVDSTSEFEFSIESEESRIYALRRGTPKALLEDLRLGRLKPANRLDLHGMSEEAARPRVFRFVRQSRRSELQCVAVVHGRGLRSPAGPVLKQALPEWLMQLPLARDVIGFGSAPADQGGDGALVIVLDSR